MADITLNADSTTLVLNERIITATVEGDVFELTYPNASTSHVNSSDGGVTANQRSDAQVADLVVRVQRFSEDDAFLNAIRNAPSLSFINGSAKEAFTRDGEASDETYSLEAGTVTSQPGKVKNTTDGNALSEYTIRFRRAIRSL